MDIAMLIHLAGLVLIGAGSALHYVPGMDSFGTPLVAFGTSLVAYTGVQAIKKNQ